MKGEEDSRTEKTEKERQSEGRHERKCSLKYSDDKFNTVKQLAFKHFFFLSVHEDIKPTPVVC